jgi:hypothetical protein
MKGSWPSVQSRTNWGRGGFLTPSALHERTGEGGLDPQCIRE